MQGNELAAIILHLPVFECFSLFLWCVLRQDLYHYVVAKEISHAGDVFDEGL